MRARKSVAGEHTPEASLRAFRTRLHASFNKRADALFELTDAILTAGSIPSPPHLSLAPVHRRGWGSLYAALSKGGIDENAVRDLLCHHPMARGDREGPGVYAMDVTSWPRCDAEASPERGYYYHPSRHSAGKPIVAGWSYQLVAEIGFTRDTWVAPMDVRRVHPEEDENDIAAEQVRDLLGRVPCRNAAAPLFVFDAGYDPVKLQRGFDELPLQLLVRLHTNRVFYADPETPEKRPVGRPYRHGAKFDFHDPETWPDPTHEAAYTQLRPAKSIVADRRLPWEKPLSQRRLTPTRVLRAFCGLLPGLGTPAAAPKPRGRSPGRPKGSLSGPARRYPAIKKAA